MTDDTFSTWQFRKTSRPMEMNSRNIGVEGHFYGRPDEPGVDNLVTAAEAGIVRVIESIRARGVIGTSEAKALPEILAHLEARTRNLRQSFAQTGKDLVDGILEFVADDSRFIPYVRRQLASDPTLLDPHVDQLIRAHQVDPTRRAEVEAVLRALCEMFLPAFVQAQRAAIDEFRTTRVPKLIEEAAKAGHIKALTGSIAPEYKIGRFSTLQFEAVRASDCALTLGDSALVHQVAGDSTPRHKPFLHHDDVLECVFLPVSPSMAIVGRAKDFRVETLAHLPVAAARCSIEFFVSHECSHRNEGLRDCIGRDATWLTDEQVSNILKGLADR